MPMNDSTGRYLSYLLRLWQTESEGRPAWRASLERPGTNERQGFASIEELVDFLWARTGQEAPRR